MDYLAHLIDPLVDGDFGSFEAPLAEVDGIGQDLAALLHAMAVAAFFHFDAFGLQEVT